MLLCAELTHFHVLQVCHTHSMSLSLCVQRVCFCEHHYFSQGVFEDVCHQRQRGESLFPSSPVLPSTLHLVSHTHTHKHTHLLPALGPRVNGCSTFPLSRSAKNYLLNDVCINIIYMVISLLLITAGLSAARGVG